MDEDPREGARLPPGTFRVGKIAGIDVLVRSSWLLVAFLIAILVAPQVEAEAPGLGALKYVAGVAFAVLLYLSVLVHEASHAIAARHYGLPVRSISIHFLGGATEIGAEAKTPRAEFVIAVVGPLTSLAVGLVSLGLYQLLPGGLLQMAVRGLAFANLVVGVLNLVPGLPLDGGRVLRAAVWKLGKDPLRATVVAAWGGRVAAGLALCWPLFQQEALGVPATLGDYLMAGVIGAFLWSGASASLVQARLRRRLPTLRARQLARRVIVVPESLSVAEAIRRAQEAEAGGIATQTGDERITGLVNEAALEAVPADRRPWLAVSQVSRAIEDGMRLPADSAGEQLVKAMTSTPASEYLLVEPDGGVYGILAASDVERAFAAGA
jgi:Zn-dependent protease/CBS domain-containing protein